MANRVARIFDEYLVASARAGDRAALERIAQHWQPKLYAHACRLMGDAEQARDVAQDGWADIIKGLPSLTETKFFPAWAYRIITRRAADRIRRNIRKRRTDAAYAAEPETADTSFKAIERSADTTPLSRAIAELTPGQAAAITLFYIDDFSIAEISVVLEVPAGTVKTRLMHARNKLRAILKGNANG